MHPLNWFRGHSRWQALVDRAIDGDLPSADEARLRAHLDTCRSCSERLAEHRAVQRALSAALPAAAPPRSFAITPEMAAAYRPTPAPAAAPRRALRTAMALQGVGAAAAVAAIGVLALDISTGTDSGGNFAADDARYESIEMAEEPGAGDDAQDAIEMSPPAATGADGEASDTSAEPEAETMAGDEPVNENAADAGEVADADRLEQNGEVTAIALEEPPGDEGLSGLVIASIILGAVAAVTLTSGLAVRIGAGRAAR